MKEYILIELAKCWEIDAASPQLENGSPDAQIQNAVDKGIREGKRECADALRNLVLILGNRNETHPNIVLTDKKDIPLKRSASWPKEG
jgi:hypothetical protein